MKTTLDSEIFLSFLFLIPLWKRNRVECVCLCVRLHFKVLLCLHTWACEFFLCGGDAPPPQRPGPVPHERRLTDLWPFYSVAVWLLKSAWMSKLHRPLSSFLPPVFPVLSSTVTGQSTAGLWTPTTPPFWDTEPALDLWWRAAELNLGDRRADGEGRKTHISYLKEEQTFHWITTLQWQRGVRKQKETIQLWIYQCFTVTWQPSLAVDVTTDDKNNLKSLHGPHVRPLYPLV